MITIADLIEPKQPVQESCLKPKLSDFYEQMKLDKEMLTIEELRAKYVGQLKLLGQAPLPPTELCFECVLAILSRKIHIVNILINRVIYAGTAHPTYHGRLLGSWLEGLQREFTMNTAAYV